MANEELAAGALILGAGGAMIANNQGGASKASAGTQSRRAQSASPFSMDEGLALMQMQQMIGLGADPQLIAQDYAMRRMSQGLGSGPYGARMLQSALDNINSSLMQGDTRYAQQIADEWNRRFSMRSEGSGMQPLPAMIEISGNRATLRFNEDTAISKLLNYAQDNYQSIQKNRLAGYNQLSEYASGSFGTDGRSSIMDYLQRQKQDQVDRILQAASVGGYNPGNAIAELERQTQELDVIASKMSGLEIQNIQQALNPNLDITRMLFDQNFGPQQLAMSQGYAADQASRSAADDRAANNSSLIYNTGAGIADLIASAGPGSDFEPPVYNPTRTPEPIPESPF